MSRLSVFNFIVNFGGLVGWASGTFANIPPAGIPDRYYIATDQQKVYRDTGSAWVLVIDGSGIPPGGYVPYNGATANVNLGNHSLSTNLLNVTGTTPYIHLDAIPAGQLPFPSSGINIGGAPLGVRIKLGTTGGMFLSVTNNTNFHNFVFPDLDGTVALLSQIPSISGLVPYTGATTLLDMGAFSVIALQFTTKNSGGFSGAISGNLLTANRSFVLPDEDGTFAMSGDVVPYVGATNDVDLGAHVLKVGDNGFNNGEIDFNNAGVYTSLFAPADAPLTQKFINLPQNSGVLPVVAFSIAYKNHVSDINAGFNSPDYECIWQISCSIFVRSISVSSISITFVYANGDNLSETVTIMSGINSTGTKVIPVLNLIIKSAGSTPVVAPSLHVVTGTAIVNFDFSVSVVQLQNT